MSKMDGLRAMREARYEAATRGTKPAATARPAVRPTPPPTEARPVAADPEPSGLCGHRNMSGRSCTREHGHAAKSHRYS
jgi:hypothetical protein